MYSKNTKIYHIDVECEEGEVALGFSLPKLSGGEGAFFFLLGFEEGGFLLVLVLALYLGLLTDAVFIADGVGESLVEPGIVVGGLPVPGLAASCQGGVCESQRLIDKLKLIPQV